MQITIKNSLCRFLRGFKCHSDELQSSTAADTHPECAHKSNGCNEHPVCSYAQCPGQSRHTSSDWLPAWIPALAVNDSSSGQQTTTECGHSWNTSLAVQHPEDAFPGDWHTKAKRYGEDDGLYHQRWTVESVRHDLCELLRPQWNGFAGGFWIRGFQVRFLCHSEPSEEDATQG